MRLTVLGSGSRGNAILLEEGATKVLVDAGFSLRTLVQRFRLAGVAPESVSHVLVTHEHGDHLKGVAAAAARWGWTVLATAGTRAAAPELAGLTVETIRAGVPVAAHGLELLPLRVPHDAAEPVALVATATASGARVGIATDLGTMPPSTLEALRAVEILVVESNHDGELLRHGPYPPSVQRRIAGGHGHLSNDAAASAVKALVHRGLRHVVLAHLSEKCNTPRHAMEAVGDALRTTRFKGTLRAAKQDLPLPAIETSGASAGQLALAL